FVDTFYWISLFSVRDSRHEIVKAFSRSLASTQLITTDEVLTEFLNFFSNSDPDIKERAAGRVAKIFKSKQINVLAQTRSSFSKGFELYQKRYDKGYSLTDCISIQTMKALNLREVLTHDKHFTQEGFTILFPN
ncbi:MAG: PIN domain-containing protein, partial [Cyanobacteria bacterium P01_H01_bin.15]